MDDNQFLEALREALSTPGRFGHREHLRLAWRCLRATDSRTAEFWMGASIRCIAAAHGTPEKYHETLTVAWTRLVAAHLTSPEASDFDGFITENHSLLDRHLPESHFSPATLWGDRARHEWVEPDLAPLPSRGAACRFGRTGRNFGRTSEDSSR